MPYNVAVLWQDMGRQMGIFRDQAETETDFCCRVMLSALSMWVLTTVGGNDESVSIMKVQHILDEKLAEYKSLLPPNSHSVSDNIANSIYKTLLNNGAFYHFQYNIKRVPHKLIGCGNIELVRGIMPQEKVLFSGLAPYLREHANDNNFENEFMLLPFGASEILELTWKRSTHVEKELHFEEYLNIERTTGRYFTNRKKPEWKLFLARNKLPGYMHKYDYYIVNGNETRRVPTDYVDVSMHEYVRLALMNQAKQQTVTALIREHIVSIDFDYLLPAPELRFLRYVSWPADMNSIDNSFKFILHPDIWPSVRDRLMLIGYEVKDTYD